MPQHRHQDLMNRNKKSEDRLSYRISKKNIKISGFFDGKAAPEEIQTFDRPELTIFSLEASPKELKEVTAL